MTRNDRLRRALIVRTLWAGLVLSATLLLSAPVAAQDPLPASTVNGEAITHEALVARVRLVRWQYLRELQTLYTATGGNLALTPSYVQRVAGSLADPLQLGADVLAQIEEERLLWQTGEALGVAPTAEEAAAQEDDFFSLWTDVPAAQLAASAEAQAFIRDWYAQATAVSGLSADDIRELFATEALRARLYARLASTVPREEPQVQTRHILCAFHPDDLGNSDPPNEEQRATARTCAQTAQIRLTNGERFEAVAMSLSDDLVSAQRGGDVGWQWLSYLAVPYADAVRDAPLHTVIGPVETVFGLHIIEVLDRRTQALSDEEYAISQQGYFALWLDTLRAEATIVRAEEWSAGLPDAPGLETLDPAVQAAIQAVLVRSG